MAAKVETMFSVRKKPWHGLGTIVMEAPTSAEALKLAGLDWQVIQEPIYTDFNEEIDGYKANVRDSDRKVLGVVSDRYKVVQNLDAFSFTDELLGKGVRYETAGSLQEGKKVWLLARLPREYIIAGERISPYLVFSNTHDGSGSVKVAVTPVRVVCNNTLNLALETANRSFSMIHTGNIQDKIQEAKDTLFMSEAYMDCLGAEFEQLRRQKMTDAQVEEYLTEKDSIEIIAFLGGEEGQAFMAVKNEEEVVYVRLAEFHLLSISSNSKLEGEVGLMTSYSWLIGKVHSSVAYCDNLNPIKALFLSEGLRVKENKLNEESSVKNEVQDGE